MIADANIRKTPPGRSEVIAKLCQHEAELRGLGVQSLYLFGSTARDQAHADSDVDLFFDYTRGEFGLFELMDVRERVAAILGRKVDVITRDSLHKSLRRQIESEAVSVFS